MMKPKTVTDENRVIVNAIATSRTLHDIIAKVTDNGKNVLDPSTLDDLEQDLYVSLLYDPKLPKLWEKQEINYYMARMVLNNLISTLSPYARTYLKFRSLSEPIPDESTGLEETDS